MCDFPSVGVSFKKDFRWLLYSKSRLFSVLVQLSSLLWKKRTVLPLSLLSLSLCRNPIGGSAAILHSSLSPLSFRLGDLRSGKKYAAPAAHSLPVFSPPTFSVTLPPHLMSTNRSILYSQSRRSKTIHPCLLHLSRHAPLVENSGSLSACLFSPTETKISNENLLSFTHKWLPKLFCLHTSCFLSTCNVHLTNSWINPKGISSSYMSQHVMLWSKDLLKSLRDTRMLYVVFYVSYPFHTRVTSCYVWLTSGQSHDKSRNWEDREIDPIYLKEGKISSSDFLYILSFICPFNLLMSILGQDHISNIDHSYEKNFAYAFFSNAL